MLSYLRALALATIVLSGGCNEIVETQAPTVTADLQSIAVDPGADESQFEVRDLGEGISISVPRHWFVLDETMRANLSASAEARLRQSGHGWTGTQSLLAMNAAPSSPGAMLRVSVKSPAELREQDFEAYIRNGQQELLAALRTEQATMVASLQAGGVNVVESFEPQIMRIGGHPAVLLRYQRASSIAGAGDMVVRQFHIASNDRTVVVTLSHRAAEAPIWTPILDYSLASISISD
ncbi:MAG: hypothetical protein JNL81_14945 [Hyphomonadaceae bacterium]|nr:hypothetical protein [Hyphomonadaceae bacterium]